MNITVIDHGKIYNCSNVRYAMLIGDALIDLFYNEYIIGKSYKHKITPGMEICFAKKRYLVTKDNIESIVSKLKIHAHNHEIIDDLATLK